MSHLLSYPLKKARQRGWSTIVVALLITAYWSPNHAQDQQNSVASPKTPETYNFPGGIAQLEIPKLSGSLPVVKFGLAEPPIIETEEHWRVLIGLDLAILPGEYLVYVKQNDSDLPASSIKFDVVQKIYPITNIDDLGSGVESRDISHNKFSEINFENSKQPELPLKLPIEGSWVDVFGSVAASEDPLSSSTDAQIQNYVYLSSTNLSIITAPQNAMVSRIILGPEPDALATVFLDHGRGVYSILSGVADLSVEVGNGIVAGAVIGKLPASIDANQPSTLIWQCIINGVYVNPLIMTELH